MAVRLTLLVAPLLGVTLVLLALLPPSSHVSSSAAPSTPQRSCSGEVVHRNTREASGCTVEPPPKGDAAGEASVAAAHVFKRQATDGGETKRAPSGFFGMRGKKDDTEEGKRAPSGFFGVRGKKLPMVSPWYPKRAPVGFFGTRGKKDSEEKRGPSMGFFGSRGKKDSEQQQKRAVQHMGFFGMRGKKAMGDESKRAPMGFFGMRGKKDWSEGGGAPMGFFGMRGKKGEEEKRGLAGAAVAAWPPYTLDSLLAYLAGREPSNGDAGALSGGSGWRPVRKRFRGSKKAPMGFIGMRGKKSQLSKEVWPPSQSEDGDDEGVESTALQSDELQRITDDATDPVLQSSGLPIY